MLIIASIVLNGTNSRHRNADKGLMTVRTKQMHTYVCKLSGLCSSNYSSDTRFCPSPVSLREPCRTKVPQVAFLRADANGEPGYLVGAVYVHIS
jgi:hypothetical protein